MDSLEMKELLEKIALQGEKQNRYLKLAAAACCGILLVAALTALILVPRAVRSLHGADETVAQIQTAVTEAQDAVREISALADAAEESLQDTSGFMKNADRVLQENAEGLSRVIDNFNSVDFESLNKAIRELSDVVEPLSEFTKIFG